jgi:hypothetical protein
LVAYGHLAADDFCRQTLVKKTLIVVINGDLQPVREALGDHIAELNRPRSHIVEPCSVATSMPSRSGNLQRIFLTDDGNEIAIHKFSLDIEQADRDANWLCRLLDVPRRRNLHSDRTGEIERQTLVGQAAVEAPEEVIAPCRVLAAAR